MGDVETQVINELDAVAARDAAIEVPRGERRRRRRALRRLRSVSGQMDIYAYGLLSGDWHQVQEWENRLIRNQSAAKPWRRARYWDRRVLRAARWGSRFGWTMTVTIPIGLISWSLASVIATSANVGHEVMSLLPLYGGILAGLPAASILGGFFGFRGGAAAALVSRNRGRLVGALLGLFRGATGGFLAGGVTAGVMTAALFVLAQLHGHHPESLLLSLRMFLAMLVAGTTVGGVVGAALGGLFGTVVGAGQGAHQDESEPPFDADR
ncbi:MAG: hypothetical protein HYV63_20455 [Candidatus Schekmanbacteria bacterium]|nr:hypothetical protein [Candidatus Schekmanbacteria bacterium]